MSTPESIKKAIKKHQAKLDAIQIHAPKGSKERWRAHAQAQGKSMTSYIIALIESDITKEEKKMKIDGIIEKINNSCKPFDIDDLREIFTAAKYSEGLEMLKTCEDTEEIPLEIIDNALFNIGYVADDAGTYRKK